MIQHNFCLNHGALGDIITSLPAIIRARQAYPAESLKLKVWSPPWQIDLIKHLLAPYGEFEVLDVTKFPLKKVEREGWNGGPVSMNSFPFNVHTRNRVHMVDFAFNCLLDARPENMLERSYPTKAALGKRIITGDAYVVFPVGATSDNKLFRASVMAPIMEWCLENWYIPVVVGTKTSYVKAEGANGHVEPIVLRDEVDKLPPGLLAKCFDLREQTTLLELRDLCGYASAVVGVDGGTVHLAGTTGTNIIYGLTTTLPKHRYIARNGDHLSKIRYVVPRDLDCAGCQSNTILTGWDFRMCPNPNCNCTEMLHPDDFVAGLQELGL